MRAIRIWVRRAIVVLVLVAVVLFVGLGVVAHFAGAGRPPNATDAPWIIQTSSRMYYAKELSLGRDGAPAIRGYWTVNGTRYRFHAGVLEFPQASFGSVSIIRRTK